MPKKECEICKGSGLKGISHTEDKLNNDVKIEMLELVMCDARCNNGFVIIVDDTSQQF